MGTDGATHGFDLFLTDLGKEWFAEILTARAFHLVEGLRSREPGEEGHLRYRRAAEARRERFSAHVDTTDLGKILDMEFRSPVWKRWGDRCLGCGSCAAVCPTCYCHGVEEEVSLDLGGAAKVRRLHACTLADFAAVAGGVNFRPDRAVRLKYRYYHKHRGFVEAFEEPLCVGCGRCGDACLAGIAVPAVIASVRSDEA
jgi:ferredoxin